MECRGIDDCWIYFDVYIPNYIKSITSISGNTITRSPKGYMSETDVLCTHMVNGKWIEVDYSLTEYHRLFATKCDKGHWHYNTRKRGANKLDL